MYFLSASSILFSLGVVLASTQLVIGLPNHKDINQDMKLILLFQIKIYFL